MMAVEERLAHVEGLVAGQSQVLADLRATVTHFEARVDQRFDQIDQRFLQIDGRFAQVEDRFTIVEGRLAALDQKIDARCDALERRLGERIGAVEGQIRELGVTVASVGQDIRRDTRVIFGWTMAGMMTIIATAFFTR